jgi:hypothetical protein
VISNQYLVGDVDGKTPILYSGIAHTVAADNIFASAVSFQSILVSGLRTSD